MINANRADQFRVRRRPSSQIAVPSERLATGRARTKAERAARKAEHAKRADFHAAASGWTPYLSVQVGDELLFVSTDDGGLGRDVFIAGWRKDMTVLIRALTWLADHELPLPPKPMLVDVGANIGTTTVMALRRHGFATGVAIEPSPEHFRTLRINLAANGIEAQVEAVPAAASDRDGQLLLDVSKSNKRSPRITEEASAHSPPGTVVVESVTLDSLVDAGVIPVERVGLVWIDAAGHEGKVLGGASKLIEASVPLVTAIRQVKGDPEQPRPWNASPGTRTAVIERLSANYTDSVELRKKSTHGRKVHAISSLSVLVNSFSSCQDLLFVWR